MNCKNCNNPIAPNATFCPICGAKNFTSPTVTPNPQLITCRNCNNTVPSDSAFCTVCGAKLFTATHIITTPVQNKTGSLASFILGLIGGIFGIFGGLCVTMCDSFVNSGLAPFILIFLGSVFGLVGACISLKNAMPGSIMQLIAALLIIICAFGITGSDFATIIAMLLFICGGIIGIITAVASKKL